MASRQAADTSDWLVALIRKEQSKARASSIESLWRVGDGVRKLRRSTPGGRWRRVLGACAERVGVSVSVLDEAVRASEAFPAGDRPALQRRWASAATPVSRSHVVELSRMAPNERARGLEALMRNALTVRELRRRLRQTIL